MSDKLFISPISLRDANDFVAKHHRHHKPVYGHKFSIACHGEILHGVAICGRPVSRMRDDGLTLEVTRLCVDGTKNAASMLLGACRRAAWALGYIRLGTYTLKSEGGCSLKAAGWKLIGERGGGSWNRSFRHRTDKAPLEKKLLWEAQ